MHIFRTFAKSCFFTSKFGRAVSVPYFAWIWVNRLRDKKFTDGAWETHVNAVLWLKQIQIHILLGQHIKFNVSPMLSLG